ncbi:hypothetical protein LXA43DRAFT_1104222 [Ganoderma leucocontextum]|nr:hypothetical protein LXA43DRAFT_1104222 [Ganoderma leucocontextum]
MARTKQTARQSTGGVAPRAELGAKPKGRTRTRRTRDGEDSDEYTPTASMKRKKGMNTQSEEVRDTEDYVTSTSGKRVRLNPPRAAKANATPVMPAIVQAEEHPAVKDVPVAVLSQPIVASTGAKPNPTPMMPATVQAEEDAVENADGEPSDGECSDGESSDGESCDRAMACLPTVLPQPVEPLIVTDLSNMFCYICQNGGSSLGCDDCDRVVCLMHVPQIAVVALDVLAKLHFRCPSCHTRRTQGDARCAPYYGIYNIGQDGKPTVPYLRQWVSVNVHAARPQHVQVNTRPILILSVRLVSLDEDSCPARFVYNYLSTWFEGPAKGYLRYVDIPFSIQNTDDADKYRARWNEILTVLGNVVHARIMLFIYTHSHDESGDLFYARKHSSASVTEWWVQVIPSKVMQIARTPSNELTIALLACGAVVNNVRSVEQLKSVASDVGAKHMFCFGATHLQAVLTVPFFMNFAQRVLLEGMELKTDNIGNTPIWFFSRATLKNDFNIDVYDWTHLTMRPHGEDIGLQCPGCGSLSSRKGTLTNDNVIVVACEKAGCVWSKTFAPPTTGIKKLTLGEKGRWRRRGMEVKSSEASAT